MKDDAIAPVLAVMLILAAIVTVLSIWNAVYVPSMKESAEIEHIKNVELAFRHFSSDIDYAVTSHQNYLVFSESVPLGGGDVAVNLIRSSGTLDVQNESVPVYTLTLANDTSPLATVKGNIVNFSYDPINNFWQDQGYTWQYGYLNVTKYGTRRTPLDYPTQNGVEGAFNNSSTPLAAFASSLASVGYERNQTPIPLYNANGTAVVGFTPNTNNCSSLDLWAVNITVSPKHSFVSSNGYGTLKLTTAIEQSTWENITNVSFSSDNIFGNVTRNSWNDTFIRINATCPDNIWYNSSSSGDLKGWDLRQGVSPVEVTLHNVTVEISAY